MGSLGFLSPILVFLSSCSYPDVDNYLLAYISFGLAYINATDTSSQITLLLKNATTVRDEYLIAGLTKCGRSYKMAISATEEAYNDLNSETYSNLRDLASVAAQSAANCEGALNGTARPSLLTRRNKGLRGLCEICVVISNLFT
ncbi:hypothetical protein IFM89_009645 [Coptis chinensis]|uniref:Pectinesterase inhibitor domain-containing protein n=1 Tax=Coptis chinensis TaxID=261450 RepID=A0A835INK8_9MAGN|nr:hypothetical protein IFM89_009645 [Coptis chinensis]